MSSGLEGVPTPADERYDGNLSRYASHHLRSGQHLSSEAEEGLSILEAGKRTGCLISYFPLWGWSRLQVQIVLFFVFIVLCFLGCWGFNSVPLSRGRSSPSRLLIPSYPLAIARRGYSVELRLSTREAQNCLREHQMGSECQVHHRRARPGTPAKCCVSYTRPSQAMLVLVNYRVTPFSVSFTLIVGADTARHTSFSSNWMPGRSSAQSRHRMNAMRNTCTLFGQ